MRRIATLLAVAGCLTGTVAAAGEGPAAGKLLVATEDLRGEVFARTVILLLQYDETGAMGLVVNRPTEVPLVEFLPESEAVAGYRGTLYWGGPVQMSTVRALRNTDAPPDGAVAIVDTVHQVPFDEAVAEGPTDAGSLRFFLGYAGWAPGQLDRELELGSWHVLPASGKFVFADDPGAIWERLKPVRELRAATGERCAFRVGSGCATAGGAPASPSDRVRGRRLRLRAVGGFVGAAEAGDRGDQHDGG